MYRTFSLARSVLVAMDLTHGLPLFAAPLEIEGLLLEHYITLDDTTLKLNGAGTWYFGPFKVNVVSDSDVRGNFKSLDEFIAQRNRSKR